MSNFNPQRLQNQVIALELDPKLANEVISELPGAMAEQTSLTAPDGEMEKMSPEALLAILSELPPEQLEAILSELQAQQAPLGGEPIPGEGAPPDLQGGLPEEQMLQPDMQGLPDMQNQGMPYSEEMPPLDIPEQEIKQQAQYVFALINSDADGIKQASEIPVYRTQEYIEEFFKSACEDGTDLETVQRLYLSSLESTEDQIHKIQAGEQVDPQTLEEVASFDPHKYTIAGTAGGLGIGAIHQMNNFDRVRSSMKGLGHKGALMNIGVPGISALLAQSLPTSVGYLAGTTIDRLRQAENQGKDNQSQIQRLLALQGQAKEQQEHYPNFYEENRGSLQDIPHDFSPDLASRLHAERMLSARDEQLTNPVGKALYSGALGQGVGQGAQHLLGAGINAVSGRRLISPALQKILTRGAGVVGATHGGYSAANNQNRARQMYDLSDLRRIQSNQKQERQLLDPTTY